MEEEFQAYNRLKLNEGENNINSNADSVRNDLNKVRADTKAAETKGLANVDFNKELAALPMSGLLSGPLIASIKAMAKSSLTTIEFIRTIAFKNSNGVADFGEPRYVKFEMEKPGAMFGFGQRKTKLEVPLLTIIPIVHLRLFKVQVELGIKLSSVRTKNIGSSKNSLNSESDTVSQTTSTQEGKFSYENRDNKYKEEVTKADGSTEWVDTGSDSTATEEAVDVDSDSWTKSSSFTGITTSYKQTNSGATVSRTYHLDIQITAVSDQMPGGLEKILDALLDGIRDQEEDKVSQALMDNITSKFGAGGVDSMGPTGGAGMATDMGDDETM